MAKFNNIFKWIFLLGFSTSLVMQVAGDDKSIVKKVNATLELIKEDFENLGKKINEQTTTQTPTVTSSIKPASSTVKPTATTKPTPTPTPTTKPTIPTSKPTIPTSKPTIPTSKPTIPTSKSTTAASKTTGHSTGHSTEHHKVQVKIQPEEVSKQETRTKRDVLSQIWEMKMLKLKNKQFVSTAPPGVKVLQDAMKEVTIVTNEIANGTIKEEQATKVETAEKNIRKITDKADPALITYMKKNPKVLDKLTKDVADASGTVKKYIKEHFENDDGSNVGAIVGGVCGGVAGVGVLGFGYYYYKKRQS